MQALGADRGVPSGTRSCRGVPVNVTELLADLVFYYTSDGTEAGCVTTHIDNGQVNTAEVQVEVHPQGSHFDRHWGMTLPVSRLDTTVEGSATTPPRTILVPPARLPGARLAGALIRRYRAGRVRPA